MDVDVNEDEQQDTRLMACGHTFECLFRVAQILRSTPPPWPFESPREESTPVEPLVLELDGLLSVFRQPHSSQAMNVGPEEEWQFNSSFQVPEELKPNLLIILCRTLASRREGAVSARQFRESGAVKSVQKAWETDFRGDASARFIATLQSYQMQFYDSINAVPGTSTIPTYACYFTVLNSSGTGKSRLMSEVAKSVFSIPMCLRAEGTTGYPPGDQNVLSFLHRSSLSPGVIDFDKCIILFCCFLSSLFLEVAGRISDNRDFQQFRTEMMAFGSGYKETGRYRQQFYDKVIASAESSFELSQGHGQEHIREYVAKTSDCLGEVLDILSRRADPGDANQSLLLVIDEAHALREGIGPSSNAASRDQLYMETALRRVMHDLGRADRTKNHRFCLVLLSTTGHIRHFYPRPYHDPSDRIFEKQYVLLKPFVSVSFDQLVSDKYYDSLRQKEIKDIGTVDVFARFGRPLFSTFYIASGRDPSSLATLAINKLLKDANVKYQLLSDRQIDPQSFALFSFRLPLPLFNIADDHIRASEYMVESYLRFCLGVDHLQNLVTCSQSEPILAALSAYVMNHYIDAMQHLICHLDALRADAGTRGEIIGSYAMLRAHDAANQRDLRPKPSSETRSNLRLVREVDFSLAHTVPIADFFSYLTGNNSKQPALPLGYVHCTHFIDRLDDLRGEKADVFLELFVRGAALQCWHGQAAIDAVIPVCYGEKLDLQGIGVIMVQYKNRATFSPRQQVDAFDRISAWRNNNFWHKSWDALRPPIDILLNLRGTPSDPEGAVEWNLSTQKSGEHIGHTHRLIIHGTSAIPSLTDVDPRTLLGSDLKVLRGEQLYAFRSGNPD